MYPINFLVQIIAYGSTGALHVMQNMKYVIVLLSERHTHGSYYACGPNLIPSGS